MASPTTTPDTTPTNESDRPTIPSDDRRAYEPVTEPNPTRPGEIPDADPVAEVIIRPDRDLYVLETRHASAYHLFYDCEHLGDPTDSVRVADVGEMRQEGWTVCGDCQLREKVRVACNGGHVPPNPDPTCRHAPDGGRTVRKVWPNPNGYHPRSFGAFRAQFDQQR